MATATKGKAKESKSTAVAKPKPVSGGAVVPVDESLMALYGEHAGSGLGNAQASDFALPFIYLLQKISPAVDEIEGAEEGMFLNTVTRDVTDDITIIPCEYDKVFIEWIPRNKGGGFVKSHRTLAEAEANRSTEKETQIVETANHYVLQEQPDGSWMPCILSLTSTKLKASRSLLSKISQVVADVPGKGRIQMPSFAKKYKVVSTGPHTNEKGRFFTVEINPVPGEDGWVTDPEVAAQALTFQASIAAGTKGADYSKVDETVVAAEDDEDEEERASGKKKF